MADPTWGNPAQQAPPANRPTMTSAPVGVYSGAPNIVGSVGWWREKRTGVAETAPGGSQSSTNDLDLDGSTYFRYPGLPAMVDVTPNPGQFVETWWLPGGQTANGRWMAAVSFTITGTSKVEFRLRAPVANPSFGRVYVNGQPVSDDVYTATATAGSGYGVTLTFPNDDTRVITVYGLNQSQGQFGGVAVEAGGTVSKPEHTPTRRVAVIGDSFVHGAAGVGATETFMWRLADLMGADEIVKAGIGATGWVTQINDDPDSLFSGRVGPVMALNPHVVIFGGGRNDSPPTGVDAAVDAALTATAAADEVYMLPTANDGQITVREAMRSGADDADRDYVGVLYSFIEISGDGTHPTYAGHQQLAEQAWEVMNGATPGDPAPPVTYPVIGSVTIPNGLRVTPDGPQLTPPPGLEVPIPTGYAVGDLIVIAVIYQAHTGTSSASLPAGFALLNERGTPENRSMVIFGRPLPHQDDVDDTPVSVHLRSAATPTRIVATAFIIKQATDLRFGDWTALNGGTFDQITLDRPASTRTLDFTYSNTGAGTLPAAHSNAAGVVAARGVSWDDGNHPTSSSTTLTVTMDSTGPIAMAPAVPNAGGLCAVVVNDPIEQFAIARSWGAEGVDLTGFTHAGQVRQIDGPHLAAQIYDNADAVVGSPFYIAHRGSGMDWPEHTMKSYHESVKHGMKAIEVSVGYTSDGVLICHHDLTTTRMTGTNYTVEDTPWATLQPLLIANSEPIPLLEDVLDKFAGRVSIWIEDKIQNGASTIALLNMLDTYPNSTDTFVWKQWAGSDVWTGAKARGYKCWGYFGEEDLIDDITNVGEPFEYIGVRRDLTDAYVQAVTSYGNTEGKPVVMWPIEKPEHRDRAVALGVDGMMTSRITGVLPVPVRPPTYTIP